MSLNKAITNSDGDKCIGIEETPAGVIYYFQNQKDVKLMVQRMLTAGVITGVQDAGDLAKKLIASACFRSAGGGCTGDCTSPFAFCHETGVPPFTFCECS